MRDGVPLPVLVHAPNLLQFLVAIGVMHHPITHGPSEMRVVGERKAVADRVSSGGREATGLARGT